MPLLTLLATIALAAPATAVTTGSATSVTTTSARVAGTIRHPDPGTSYHVDYGPDASYGTSTPSTAAPAAGGTVRVQLNGLQPATTYHYRLVAQSSAGTTAGADRTFTTHRPPVALRLTTGSRVLAYGSPALLAGAVAGPGAGGMQVALQSRPVATGGTFVTVGPAGMTAPDGSFGFRVPALTASTEFRVVTSDSPPQTSHPVRALVRPAITTRLRPARPRAGRRVRFSGTIRPARDGARFALQKRTARGWVTVAGGVAHHAPRGVSTWGATIVVRRGGEYRVFVRVSGSLVSGAGSVKHVRLRQR